ncbi:tetratricopeptide repeat protein [Gammaproteobacteria bacterium]|nr:tetratricopeptide repeat protein [Gammaproteobacteria bacterium]
MSEYISDEEQMNRFGEWWNDHGTSLLIAVGLAIASIVGWNFYSDNRQQNLEASTALYAEYVDAAAEAKAAIAQQIKTEFPGTSVHSLVALDEAKKAADDANLAAATQALVEARDAAPDALLAELAMIRLAKLQYAQGNAEEALQTLQGIRNPGYQSWALELTGDIYLAEGNSEQAYAAYTSALDGLEGDANRPLLEIKRDNAAPADGEFTVFSQPLNQALKRARETLATDESAPEE